MKLIGIITRSLQADMQAELRDIERAVHAGTREAGCGLRTELRRQVTSAGLGQRHANSWRDRHYPNQKLDAASLAYTKAPQIVRAFDEGAVIRSRRGRCLAIPTENAPRKGTDGRRVSPTRWAAEAAQGTGEVKDALAEMGIALRDQSGNLRRSEDLLGDVADAFAHRGPGRAGAACVQAVRFRRRGGGQPAPRRQRCLNRIPQEARARIARGLPA